MAVSVCEVKHAVQSTKGGHNFGAPSRDGKVQAACVKREAFHTTSNLKGRQLIGRAGSYLPCPPL